MQNLNNLKLEELTPEELDEIEGGILPLVAYGAGLLVGAAMGHGTAALIDHIF